ncbi:uncharacterized protein LY79DRAFT_245397 [Colletotrichum navitas]|uniref:Uncharacterized protein n=1 Tax=Colletotrichum navitas TaxID=681940 RepID=A0AAD8PWP8_9PEZI|nr:uncharacterized protein LY79DRAFT_245397 [Colletotrichum navitas]KAK1586054.1 hypothetical protein LY79DRAFT_245397 [Colletotrichum navitas]
MVGMLRNFGTCECVTIQRDGRHPICVYLHGTVSLDVWELPSSLSKAYKSSPPALTLWRPDPRKHPTVVVVVVDGRTSRSWPAGKGQGMGTIEAAPLRASSHRPGCMRESAGNDTDGRAPFPLGSIDSTSENEHGWAGWTFARVQRLLLDSTGPTRFPRPPPNRGSWPRGSALLGAFVMSYG